MINTSHLHLHLAQLLCLLENAEVKQYDTDRITKHLEDIKQVLDRLAQLNLENLNETQRELIREILDYFSSSLKYVLDSTVDDVPSEIFYGLRKAMEDWLEEPETYILVASEGNYCFQYNNKTNDIYDTIQRTFGITLKHKLVFFGVPAHLKNDFACNTALYHELGHFIDLVHFHFSETIFIQIVKGEIPFNFVQFCGYQNSSMDVNRLYYHLLEYFADLFAAQYIGKSAYMYLEYVGQNNNASDSHPSTKNRIKLIDEFIDNTKGEFISLIELYKDQVNQSKRELINRSSNIDLSNFLSNQHIVLNEKRDIHKMISSLWSLWDIHKNQFKDETGKTMTPHEAYKHISKLFEKSIKNLRN